MSEVILDRWYEHGSIRGLLLKLKVASAEGQQTESTDKGM
jgi:hypothetical protein